MFQLFSKLLQKVKEKVSLTDTNVRGGSNLQHSVSHPPRSLTASSNLFSFMAFWTSFVCRSNPQGVRTSLGVLTTFSKNAVQNSSDSSPSPHTPWEADEQRSYPRGRWHTEECLVRPPSGPPPPPHPAYCSGTQEETLWGLACTEQ